MNSKPEEIQHVIMVIKHVPDYVNETELFHCIENLSLPKEEYYKAKIDAENEVADEKEGRTRSEEVSER